MPQDGPHVGSSWGVECGLGPQLGPSLGLRNPGSEKLFFLFSPVTGRKRPILPGLHKSKQEDSKGERQEERVREAQREKSGGILGGILGSCWGVSGYLGGILRDLGDLGVLEVGSGRGNRGSGGLCRTFFHCKKHKQGHSQPSAPVTLFMFFCSGRSHRFYVFLQWQKVLDTPKAQLMLMMLGSWGGRVWFGSIKSLPKSPSTAMVGASCWWSGRMAAPQDPSNIPQHA